MTRFSSEFKLQCVKKALSRSHTQTQRNIAEDMGVGYSTLQRWVRLAKDNKLEKLESPMSKEKSPHDWNKAQRFEAIVNCHGMTTEQVSAYCRKNGIYLHHLDAWKREFLSEKTATGSVFKQENKKLSQENKQLQKELRRKDKALSETAALLVLSKKCQAIWGGMADE